MVSSLSHNATHFCYDMRVRELVASQACMLSDSFRGGQNKPCALRAKYAAGTCVTNLLVVGGKTAGLP